MAPLRLNNHGRIALLLQDLPFPGLLDELLLRLFAPHELAEVSGLAIRLRLGDLRLCEVVGGTGGGFGGRGGALVSVAEGELACFAGFVGLLRCRRGVALVGGGEWLCWGSLCLGLGLGLGFGAPSGKS